MEGRKRSLIIKSEGDILSSPDNYAIVAVCLVSTAIYSRHPKNITYVGVQPMSLLIDYPHIAIQILMKREAGTRLRV